MEDTNNEFYYLSDREIPIYIGEISMRFPSMTIRTIRPTSQFLFWILNNSNDVMQQYNVSIALSLIASLRGEKHLIYNDKSALKSLLQVIKRILHGLSGNTMFCFTCECWVLGKSLETFGLSWFSQPNIRAGNKTWHLPQSHIRSSIFFTLRLQNVA